VTRIFIQIKMFWTAVVILLIVYMLIDIHYVLRVFALHAIARFFPRKIGMLEPSSIYGICLPSDADFLLTHMNNARYLREHDFGRFEHAVRSGIPIVSFDPSYSFPASAITIRYRQPLMMFSVYKVVTAPIWWDKKAIYYEHRIITLKDGIVRSIAYTKLAVVKRDLDEVIKELFPDVKKPDQPEDLKKWIEFNELSSEKMKVK